jgi:uncharacterized cupredoxin-like copper-binding protein
MTMTLDAPVSSEPVPETNAPVDPDLDDLRALENRLDRRSNRRDGWTLMMFGVALGALMFSVVAVGFGLRAIDQSKQHLQTAPTPAPPPPVALSGVTLSDMKVTPSSTITPAGKYTVTMSNAGQIPHELLVFHTDVAPANLAIGPDGKVNEDAPGFKVSDGDNIAPGTNQSRVIDLTQPGTYLFVCNLPGHFMAGMHTVVTVQ